MAMVITPVFQQTMQNWNTQILPADASGLKTLLTGATNGTRIYGWLVYSSDSVARDVVITFTIGGTDYSLTTVSIPINAGNTNAIVPVDILRSSQFPGLTRDSNGNPFLEVKSTTTIKVNTATTVTAAKVINMLLWGWDF